MNLIELTNKLIEKCHIRTYREMEFFRGVLKEWHRWDAKKFHGIYPTDVYLRLAKAIFDDLLKVIDMKEPTMTVQTFDMTVQFLEQFIYCNPMEVAGSELNNLLT